MASVSYDGNIRSSPRWAGDFLNSEHLLPVPARIDPTQFTTYGGIKVTTTAIAAQGATSVSVTALTYPFNSSSSTSALISAGNTVIPAGTVLYFGGAKVATLTAPAALGATTLTVAALPTALASGDSATFNKFGTLFIPSGVVIGRTWTERDAGTAYGPAANTDNELWVTAFDVVDANANPDVVLVRPTVVLKENYLPDYGTTGSLGTSASPTSLLTALRAKYPCIQGVN